MAWTQPESDQYCRVTEDWQSRVTSDQTVRAVAPYDAWTPQTGAAPGWTDATPTAVTWTILSPAP